MRRIVLPALSAFVLVAGLTACTSTDSTPDPEATTASTDVCAVESGEASESVAVSGDFGSAPEATVTPGLTTDVTQRTVVIDGSGDDVPAGATATVAYSLYNGTSGELIDSYGYDAGQSVSFTADVTTVMPGIAKTIGCTTVGSRVVSVVSAADAFGDEGYADLGVAAGDSLVFVMDITGLVPSRATGVDQPVVAGLPTVELASDGAPTVTLPGTDAPTDLQIAVLKLGDGAVVTADSTVTIQYTGVAWSTGAVFDQSWGATGPVTLQLSELVDGFAQAMTGQAAGSQILAVIPPALAYAGTESDLADETLVFVIDILSVS